MILIVNAEKPMNTVVTYYLKQRGSHNDHKAIISVMVSQSHNYIYTCQNSRVHFDLVYIQGRSIYRLVRTTLNF